MTDYKIIIRGAGDISTGTIHRLFRAGFRPLVLEADHPSAIRRQVAMSECVYDGEATVEGVKAVLVHSLEEAEEVIDKAVPVLIDPKGSCISRYKPDVVIDAILAKKNLGMTKDMAPLTIALGPGFTAGEDVDYVIETMRGHNLARIIENGPAMPHTGTPGLIAGIGKERVIHSPADGILRNVHHIADTVEIGEEIAFIETADHKRVSIPASISGLIRGLIRDGYPVTKGFKIADIDPRLGEYKNCFTISDKARCIAGSVLELVSADFMRKLQA